MNTENQSPKSPVVIIGVAVALILGLTVFAVTRGSTSTASDPVNVIVDEVPPPTTSKPIARPEVPPWEASPWEYDVDAVDFAWMGAPTFDATLAELGPERIREIEFFLPPGDGDIAFAIRNPDPIRTNGQGIAVRTDTFAQILRSSEAFEMPRPEECIDGNCRLFMWLTMGPQFLDTHPEAALLIWAGDGSAVTIEPVPMENLSDETFRR